MKIIRLALLTAVLLLGAVPRRAVADPALWVAHTGNATVYLFGTIHVLPANTQWMDSTIRIALASATEIWTEADLGDLSTSVAAIRHYGLGATHPTETLLPPEYRNRYRKDVAESGMPPALFAHAQPWLAEILLSAAAMERARSMGLGVEASLMAYARDHHISTPTFETLDQQFAMMADMPAVDQIASLEEQIDEFDDAGRQFDALLSAWRSGDDVLLDKLTNQDMRSHSEAVWTELILRRNEKFAQRIEDRLEGSGTAFVAIGAAHLVGSTGVPALLRAHGITVDRVR